MNEQTPRDKIVERIRKLLALSSDKGVTEAEAIAAVMMAQRLMNENDVADWELHTSDEQPIESASSEPVERRWRWELANAIAENFRCRYYQNRELEEENGWKRVARMHFYGYRSDATAAALAFDYLYKIGNRLALKHSAEVRREYGYSDGAYNGFVLGFTKGIRSELEKQSQSLMIVVPPKVSVSYESFSIGFGEANTHLNLPGCFEGEAYAVGYGQGRDAVRSQRMEAADTEQEPNGLLLA